MVWWLYPHLADANLRFASNRPSFKKLKQGMQESGTGREAENRVPED
jgi:hypothetical protein